MPGMVMDEWMASKPLVCVGWFMGMGVGTVPLLVPIAVGAVIIIDASRLAMPTRRGVFIDQKCELYYQSILIIVFYLRNCPAADLMDSGSWYVWACMIGCPCCHLSGIR